MIKVNILQRVILIIGTVLLVLILINPPPETKIPNPVRLERGIASPVIVPDSIMVFVRVIAVIAGTTFVVIACKSN